MCQLTTTEVIEMGNRPEIEKKPEYELFDKEDLLKRTQFLYEDLLYCTQKYISIQAYGDDYEKSQAKHNLKCARQYWKEHKIMCEKYAMDKMVLGK